MKMPPSSALWASLMFLLGGAAAALAAPVSQLEVRVVTGDRELIAGSALELRIYEIGRNPRRFALVHNESWPADSTHVIPLRLSEPLDPRNVLRFSLAYRSPIVAAGELDIVSAEVDYPADAGSERLLGATLSGVIARQGELATEERDPSSVVCRTDADCDDHLTCDGVERCAPRTAGADAHGCVKGTPVSCPVNQICGEGVGCRGISGSTATH
jgi:hypothetical protein